MSWGTGSWGTGTWGGVSVFTTNLFVSNAFALTTNTVRVVFSVPPDVSSNTAVGSATNPASWSVTRLDSGFSFTVTLVEQVAIPEESEVVPTSIDPTTTFDVHVLEPLGSLAITHQIAALGILRESDGAAMVPPTTFDFLGLGFTQTERPNAVVQRQIVAVDVANPPFPPTGFSIGGTLQINAFGDYEAVRGAELVRKLIIRRLTTPRGGFVHLPDYGIGFAVKEKIPSSDLIRLRAILEQQVLLEPEVEACSVIPTLQRSNNILQLQIQARLRPGSNTVLATVSLSPDGVIL